MSVRQLGYLVFEVAPQSAEGMTSVFRDVMQAPLTDRGDGDVLVRLDGRPFRIMLSKGERNRLAAIGWEVESGEALDTIVATLAGSGIACAALAPEECADRAVERGISFSDADGFPVELFVDLPFVADPETGAKFVCGSDPVGAFGLGHLVQICRDRAAAQAFYADALGFRLSDRITWDVADLYFLHCNKRHHSLALSGEAFGLKAGMIDHVMIEARSKAQVDEAYARLATLGFPVSATLGQHTNDHVYSFYMICPMGFRIEFGFGGRVVEDSTTWQVVQYDAPSSWGHEMLHAG
jgi:2,3-dihydroxybiphenyl 1,2-dioxygenase